MPSKGARRRKNKQAQTSVKPAIPTRPNAPAPAKPNAPVSAKTNTPVKTNTAALMPVTALMETKPQPVAQEGTLFAVAPIWRRIVAWVIDAALIALLAQLAGLTLREFLFQAGPYGRFFGIAAALAYFGLLDSRLGNGQTLGKRLLRIAVRDSHNQPIGIVRAILRDAVFVLPFFMNAWALPLLRELPILAAVATTIEFGVGAAIVYTAIVNFRNGQALQDMLLGTHVVALRAKRIAAYAPVKRTHWYVAAALIVLPFLYGMIQPIFQPSLAAVPGFQALQQVHETLVADPRFFSASVSTQSVVTTANKPARMLAVEVWYTGALPNPQQRADILSSIAPVVLKQGQAIGNYDYLRISVRSQYDLGIAEGDITGSDTQTMDVWRSRVK